MHNRYAICFQSPLKTIFENYQTESSFLTFRRYHAGTEAMFADLGHFSVRSIQVLSIDSFAVQNLNANLDLSFKVTNVNRLTMLMVCGLLDCLYWNSVPCFNMRICGPSCLSHEVSRRCCRHFL